MIMKKLYRDDTLSSRKITHVLSPLPEVAGCVLATLGRVQYNSPFCDQVS